MRDPLISISVPNYNHGASLQRTIDGVLSQSFQNWELLLLDDGSTDHSREIMERNAARDSRIRIYFSPENRGVIKTHNWGLTLIRGDFFVGGAADDFLTSPDFLADAMEIFQQHPQLGIFVGLARALKIDEVGNEPEKVWVHGHAPREGYYSGREAIERYLNKTLDAHGACTVVRADYIKKIGYDEKLGPLADAAVYWAAAANQGLVFREKIYMTLTKGDRNFTSSITLHHHSAWERKLRSLISYGAEIEPLFLQHRLQLMANLIRLGINIKSHEIDSVIEEMVNQVLVFYPPILLSQPRKQALASLGIFLRRTVRHPVLFAGIHQLVPLMDHVMRPFYPAEEPVGSLERDAK